MVLAVVLFGCAPAPASVDRPLEEAPRLVAIGEPIEGPDGADARVRTAVAFEMPDGTRRAVDREAIAFVARWRGRAALVDPERRLYEVEPGGMRRMLGRNAVGELATDGEHLAFVVERGGFGALHVHDGARDTTVVEGFASIGALNVEGDTIVFVGARPGGVVGVWIVEVGAAPRCLSNCALRVGEPITDRMVPVPTQGRDVVLTPTRVAWTVDGVPYEATR